MITWGAMVYTADEAAKQLEERRRLGRDRRPAHGHAVGQGGRARERAQDARRCSSCTRTRAPAASAPRSRRRSPRRRSRTSTRPVKRIAAPDTPVPFSPPLEKAFIPQVDDVAAGLQRARGVLGGAPWPPEPRSTSSCRRWACPSPRARSRSGSSRRARRVEADEALLEISTDKVDTEVPSPASGVVAADPRPGGRDGRGRHDARRDRARGRRRRRRRRARRRPSRRRRRRPTSRWPPRARASATSRRRPPQPAPSPRPRRAAPPAEPPQPSRRSGTAARSSRRSSRGSPPSTASTRPGAGHRPRRPRDEEGHPRLHRVGGAAAQRHASQASARRRRAAPAPPPAPAAPRSRAGAAARRAAQRRRRPAPAAAGRGAAPASSSSR